MPFIASDSPRATYGWNDSGPLFIKGSPDVLNYIPLYIGPSQSFEDVTSLFLPGPTGSSMTLVMLDMKRDNNEAPLYTNANIGGGGAGYQGTATLVILRGLDGSAETLTATLYLNGPDKEYYNTNASLFISTAPNPTDSAELETFILGADSGLNTSSIPLLIRSFDEHTDNATLHIETDFNKGGNTSLFIADRLSNEIIPLVIDGKTVEDDSITLFIRPIVNDSATLFSRGYRE
jgi:hypothetical protein